MRKTIILTSISLSVLVIIARLFLGVYSHDEFGGTHLFIKHRSVWKWSFYSPTGMSDLQLEDLSPEKQYEERMFQEFVWEQGLSR